MTQVNKKLSYRWQKPARRIYRSVKVTKHTGSTIVRYGFLLCNCNIVFKTRRFCAIPLQKCYDLEGHWKWYNSI